MTDSKRILLPLVTALVLAGCASVDVARDHPLPEAPSAFRQGSATAESEKLRSDWWQIFADAQLNQLVDEAMTNSTTIQAAAARLTQARAASGLTDAQRMPQLGVSAGTGRSGGGYYQSLNEAGSLHQVRADASYEIDFVGKLSDASHAARLDVQAADSLLSQARLLVQANVAQTYFALRAIDAERDLMRDTLVSYRASLELTERRRRDGDLAELDVERMRTEVATTESEALALDRQRETLESTLAVLVGTRPGAFSLPSTTWNTALPAVPAGLPSDMLARRPDVVAAKASFDAAQLRIGAAQKDWFPSLTLTASGGSASPALAQLFKSSAGLWGVNALLSMPLLDGGRRSANIQAATGQAEQAAAQYREQVLQAFKDVEDQLSGLDFLKAQDRAQTAAVQSAEHVLHLSDSRYRNGMVSQLDLLDAQRTELASRRQALQVKSAQFEATVALVKALGGGWGDS